MSDLVVKSNLPAFMQEDMQEGALDLRQYVRPPRLKLVADTATRELKAKFPPGSAVLLPNEVKLGDLENSFDFIPVFFWQEYCSINPIQLKSELPMIRERTTDRDSALARKCLDPKSWYETCPEDPTYRVYNAEMLNFAFMPTDMSVGPCVMTFSKGEHRTGRRLASLIFSRRAPIFGCVFTAKVGVHRDRDKQYEFYGLDIENSMTPFVEDAEQYEVLREMHRTLRDQHDKNLVQADYDGFEDEEPATEY